jgi:acetylserotonin O-methyltransferase
MDIIGPDSCLPKGRATVTQDPRTTPPTSEPEFARPARKTTVTEDTYELPEPTTVLDLISGFRRSKTMFAAVSLKVFDALASRSKSCAELATHLQLNADALERLLDACVGLKLLEHHDGSYEITQVSKTYLLSESPLKLTGYINCSNYSFWGLWGCLEGAIREGTNRYKEAFDFDGPYWEYLFRTEEHKTHFLNGMHGFGQITSPNLVRAFDLSEYTLLIDLGGGTGHFAIAACKEYPDLRATVFETPEASGDASKAVNASPYRDRIDVVSGDFFEDDLPVGDLYCLARVLHNWPEAKILALLKKIFDRMKPEGALLVAEKLLNEDRSGPFWAQMQNLNMLVIAEGKERTLTQYGALLGKVGFAAVRAAVTDSPLDCILAQKQPVEKTKPRIESISGAAVHGADEELEVRPQTRRSEFAIEAEMYWAFFEQADMGFVIADMDGRFLLVNEAFARILDRTVADTLRLNYKDITPRNYAKEDAEQIRILGLKKTVRPFVKQYIRKSGSLATVRVTLKIIEFRGKDHIWASVESVGQDEISAKLGRIVKFVEV